MKIVAITGLPGAGKTEAAAFFVKGDFKKIRFGDITDEIIEQRNLVNNEESNKLIREEIRKKYGPEAFAKLNLDKIKELSKSHSIVIDGLYSYEEFEFLKEHFPSLVLISIDAEPALRYNRISSRKIRTWTIEEAKARDKSQLANLNIKKTIDNAHHKIINNSSLEELYKKLESIQL